MQITYKQNPLSKRIRVTIMRDGAVLVTYPKYVSKKRAEKFVAENLTKIERAIAKTSTARSLFEENQKLNLLTKQIIIKRCDENNMHVFAKENFICVPQSFNFNDNKVQAEIKSVFTELVRREAKKYLPTRTEYFARKYGFSFERVYVKNIKTRWGSCSKRNNINLNIHLMRLPSHLCDYVILHELVHTEVKNHGKEFWARLNRITNGEAKKLDKELNKYQIGF